MPHCGRRSSSSAGTTGRSRRTPRAYDVRSGRSGVAGRHRGGRRHQLDHAVSGREHGRPVGHHDHQAALREEGEGLEEDLLGLLVEVGARLVEEHDRTVRRARRGPARPGPAGPRRVRRRPRRGACPGRGGARPRRRPGRRCAGPPTPRRRRAEGRPIRTLAPTVSASSHGRWGAHATRLRHQPGSRSASGVPPSRTSPAAGASSPRERGQQRRLAAARRPGDRDQAPARAARGRADAVRASAGGVADLEVGAARDRSRWAAPCRSRPAPARASRASASARAAVPSAAAWNSAPDPAQRPVGLGGEQQDGEGDLEVDAPRGQPQADRHRHQRDRQGGDQLQHGRGGEGDLEGVDGRAAVAVGDRRGWCRPVPRRGGGRRGSAARAPRRGSAPTAPRARATACRARSRVVSPTSTAKTGTSGRVRATTRPESGSSQAIAASVDDGQDGGRHERGQVAGDVGLDAGHAAGGQDGQRGRATGRRRGAAASRSRCRSAPETSPAARAAAR